MQTNKYIRRLIRMYQKSYLDQLDEILQKKPKEWDECKEYFKLWIDRLFLSDTTIRFVLHHYHRRGALSFMEHMKQYIKESLDDEILL